MQQRIMDTYLVENHSSFAIQEFFENCLNFSRQILETKRAIFASKLSHDKFFEELGAKKRTDKIKQKMIPDRIKEGLKASYGAAEPLVESSDDGKKTLQVQIPSEPQSEAEAESE